MNARLASLKILAERWVERRPPDFSRKRFLEFAQAIYDYYPGFTAINWIDPQGRIQWVFPEWNTGTRHRSVFEHGNTGYTRAFEKARQTLEPTYSPCLTLFTGGLGFETFWPLVYEGRVQGYLNGVFEVGRIMDACLAKDMLEDFWVGLYEEGRLIYSSPRPIKAGHNEDRVSASCAIRLPGRTWQLILQPRPPICPPGAIWNLPFLVFGLLISMALSLLLYLLLHRMALFREATDHALFQVNERKKAEEALRENEIRLQSLVKELEGKNAELETFVYSVSHDLKTPIVTIEGFIGAFEEDFGDRLPQDGRRYLQYMSDAARKMDLLINDLLELSRIGRLSEKKAAFPLQDVVKEVVSGLTRQIGEKGITLDVQETLPFVYGERKRIAQVLENLLSNAIKYMGKDNPSPRIEVGVKREKGQEVIFVRDNGIGIEKDYFEKIFDVFQRLPPAKGLDQGTGVGLTIVKRIVEQHGGSIWLTSNPQQGTTFFFTLKDKE